MGLAALEGAAVKEPFKVRSLAFSVCCGCLILWLGASGVCAKQTVVIVTGAAGSTEFEEPLSAWAQQWEKACAQARVDCIRIGLGATETPDRDTLRDLLADPALRQGREPLWLVLMGHGTFDGRSAKFNLRGPDLSERDLAQWLLPVTRPVAVIDTTACSSPFLKALSGPERVVISATKSGFELNFAYLGGALAKAIVDPNADLDKDGQTSLLEAFLTAADEVTAFYKSQGRIKTEHALLDDNADGLGTPADWFVGLRPTKRAAEGASLDGYRAHQFRLLPSDQEKRFPENLRARRNQLELQVMQLRDNRATFPEDEYYAKLEVLLLDLARIYEKVDTGS